MDGASSTSSSDRGEETCFLHLHPVDPEAARGNGRIRFEHSSGELQSFSVKLDDARFRIPFSFSTVRPAWAFRIQCICSQQTVTRQCIFRFLLSPPSSAPSFLFWMRSRQAAGYGFGGVLDDVETASSLWRRCKSPREDFGGQPWLYQRYPRSAALFLDVFQSSAKISDFCVNRGALYATGCCPTSEVLVFAGPAFSPGVCVRRAAATPAAGVLCSMPRFESGQWRVDPAIPVQSASQPLPLVPAERCFCMRLWRPAAAPEDVILRAV